MFWIVVDVLVCIALFALPFAIEVLKIKKLPRFEWRGILINSLIGILFVVTYIAFRYFHKDWKMFGFLHSFGLISSLAMPFALAYLCKNTNKARLVAIIMAGIIFLSPITRPIFLPMARNMSSIKDWDMAIPFNLCNISALVFIFGILLDNKLIKNYMITFGLFGGIINNIQAHNLHLDGFWHYVTAESYIVHAIIIIIPLFMLLTGQIKPNAKYATLNAVWILPFYLFAGFFLNPLWDVNFHFTRPIAFMSFLPQMANPFIIFGNEVDLLYMTEMMVLVIVAGVLLYYLSKFIYGKSKYFVASANNKKND